MHGAGERGNGTTELEKVKVHGLPKYLSEGKEYPAISMGGFGTWEMGISYPELFSAIAPVCGGLSWRCESLKNMPIWAFHGDIDDIVSLKNSVEMVDAVNKIGGNAKLTIFHNVGHNSWEEAYTATNVVEWLISKNKSL